MKNRTVDENRKTTGIFRIAIVVLLLVVFALMLTFNLLTPMASDDYAHYFGMEGEHVTTLPEILRNMKLFRTETNGRVFPHFWVYVFLALPGEVFCVINAAVAVLIAFLMMRFYAEGTCWKDLLLLAGSLSAMWLFTPAFGEIYLWKTGSVNYSWGLALDLAFLYPYFRAYTDGKETDTGMCAENANIKRLRYGCAVNESKNRICHILFCLLAFVTGAWSENGGTAVLCAGGLTGLLIWIKEKKFPGTLFAAYIFALLGFAFLMTAPATSGRTGTDISENIWYLRVLARKFLPVPAGVYALLFVLANIGKTEKKVTVFSAILVVAAGFSLAVFIFAAYIPNRGFMIAVSFLILADVILLSQMLRTRIGICTVVIPVMAILLFFCSFPKGAKDIYYLYEMQRQRESIIGTAMASGEREVTIPRFVTETDYPACPEEELSTDSSDWYNDLVARYYGLLSVTAEPDV